MEATSLIRFRCRGSWSSFKGNEDMCYYCAFFVGHNAGNVRSRLLIRGWLLREADWRQSQH
jgi:hypothetical protein